MNKIITPICFEIFWGSKKIEQLSVNELLKAIQTSLSNGDIIASNLLFSFYIGDMVAFTTYCLAYQNSFSKLIKINLN